MGTRHRYILVQVGNRLCALAVSGVEEILRPLPLVPVPGAPPFVVGASVLRGAPVPVVDAGLLLGEPRLPRPGRLVSLRPTAGGRAALLVDAVPGFAPEGLDHAPLPPLLTSAPAAVVEALGTADAELLTFLSLARVVPEALSAGGAP